MDPLTFRCTGCGNCCRNLRAAVTLSDVARLMAATGRAPVDLVEWLAPAGVDMTGEPDSFVELNEGRRLMVLAQRSGACHLLAADNRCSVYAARPMDCRAYPFDFAAAPEPRRLQLLPLDGCDYASDGRNDAAEITAVDAQRWLELQVSQRIISEWNRLATYRRRLHHRLGSAADFFPFALERLPATDTSS